jgi:Protein of unknown function (DUF3011)
MSPLRAAIFLILAGVATSATAEQITCESRGGSAEPCGTVAAGSTVRIARQLSNSPCIEGRTWGTGPSNDSIWVSGGCRAVFDVQPPNNSTAQPRSKMIALPIARPIGNAVIRTASAERSTTAPIHRTTVWAFARARTRPKMTSATARLEAPVGMKSRWVTNHEKTNNRAVTNHAVTIVLKDRVMQAPIACAPMRDAPVSSRLPPMDHSGAMTLRRPTCAGLVTASLPSASIHPMDD